MAPEKATAVLLLIACLVDLVGAEGPSDNTIKLGYVISADHSEYSVWKSNSRKFGFGFYKKGGGFAVGIQFYLNTSHSTVIWTADRDQKAIPGNSKLSFSNEGLVLNPDKGGQPIFDLPDANLQPSFASMDDSGNFIIYDDNNNTVWQAFDYPTDTLMAGQVFSKGNNLISGISANDHSSGRFRFAMQQDGNAVLYPVNTPITTAHAYWALGQGSPGLVLDNNGNLIKSVTPQNSSQGNGSICFLRIEPDGYLRIYITNQSGLMTVSNQYPRGDNKCFIKGQCGLNSYCNSTGNGQVSCFCLPGYVYIDPSRVFAGCQRNFTKGSCEAVSGSTSNRAFYNISRLPNITWSDNNYNSSQVQSEDECSSACLLDCDCYAALFFSSRKVCNKQRHPFLYARAALEGDEPTVALLKVVDAGLQISAKPISTGSLRALSKLSLVLSLLLTATFAVVLDLLIFYLCRHRIGLYRRLCDSMEPALAKAMAPRCFSYRQLEEATDGFKEVIGEGSYGKVFKGLLPPRDAGTLIAVKKLKNVPSTIEEKFRNELKSTGRVHHRNVVRLLGFCLERSDWILVYEYMSRGSLADLIFKWQETPPSWRLRASIAMDVARGLCHLHEGCDVAIIHGDIKPENVLIGDDNRAKIGDLGLAKHLQPGKLVTYTRSRGTANYKAPEWANSYDYVSPKADVVSYGVLLLELISLKKFQQPQGLDGEYNLASWAYKCLKGQSQWQVLGNDVDATELEVMVKIALWCLHGSPEKRLSMYDVVMMLDRKKAVEFPPVPLIDWIIAAPCRS